MKDKYISRVRRKLSLPRAVKAEVVSDLEEIFAMACERGESEVATISRLGTPEEYVKATEAAFGVDGARLRRKRFAVAAVVFAFIAVAASACAIATGVSVERIPEGAIGYAETMTDIEVEGAGFGVYAAALGAGAVAICAAIACGVAAKVTSEKR